MGRRPYPTPRTVMSMSLPADLLRLLHDYSNETGVKKVQAVELALRRFLAAEADRIGDPGDGA